MTTSTVTPTRYEKDEWSRFARAAYAAQLNSVGHRYSVAASLPRNAPMTIGAFDALQKDYRAWLVFGRFPQLEDIDRQMTERAAAKIKRCST